MNISEQGLALIKRHEKLRLTAQLNEVGIIVIGYGTAIINGAPVEPSTVINKEMADKLLMDDLDAVECQVGDLIDVPTTQKQFDALVSFTHQLGPGNLKRSSLRKHLNAGRYEAAQLEFLRWNKASGLQQRHMVLRRLDEAVLFGTMSREDLIAVSKLKDLQ